MSEKRRFLDDIPEALAPNPSPSPERAPALDDDDRVPGFGAMVAPAATTIGRNRHGVVRRRKRQKRRKLPAIAEVLARPKDHRHAVGTWPAEFHWDIVRYCNQQVASRHLEGRTLVPKASSLLVPLGNPCLGAQIKCCLAMSERLSERLASAEEILLAALSRTAECWACDADLSVQLAAVLVDQRRFPEAFERLDHSIAVYRDRMDAGHDLDRNGLAKAMIGRGIALHEMGRRGEAIEQLSSALKEIEPRISRRWYRNATLNLAVALAESERPQHFKTAFSHLESLYHWFGRTRKATIERAMFLWLYGKILIRLGSTSDGLRAMRRSRQDLLELRIPQAVLAITCDLGRVDASRYDIGRMMRDLTEKVDGRVRIQDWIPKKYWRSIKKILDAATTDRPTGNLDRLLRDLRELTAGRQVLPCLLAG